MSGGCYDYAYRQIENLAQDINVRAIYGDSVAGSSGILRRAFALHLLSVAAAARAIEWNDSGDGANDEGELIRRVVSPSTELASAVVDAKTILDQLQSAIDRAFEDK